MTVRPALLVLAATAVAVPPGGAQEVGLPIGTAPATTELEDLEGNAVILQAPTGLGNGYPLDLEFPGELTVRQPSFKLFS